MSSSSSSTSPPAPKPPGSGKGKEVLSIQPPSGSPATGSTPGSPTGKKKHIISYLTDLTEDNYENAPPVTPSSAASDKTIQGFVSSRVLKSQHICVVACPSCTANITIETTQPASVLRSSLAADSLTFGKNITPGTITADAFMSLPSSTIVRDDGKILIASRDDLLHLIQTLVVPIADIKSDADKTALAELLAPRSYSKKQRSSDVADKMTFAVNQTKHTYVPCPVFSALRGLPKAADKDKDLLEMKQFFRTSINPFLFVPRSQESLTGPATSQVAYAASDVSDIESIASSHTSATLQNSIKLFAEIATLLSSGFPAIDNNAVKYVRAITDRLNKNQGPTRLESIFQNRPYDLVDEIFYEMLTQHSIEDIRTFVSYTSHECPVYTLCPLNVFARLQNLRPELTPTLSVIFSNSLIEFIVDHIHPDDHPGSFLSFVKNISSHTAREYVLNFVNE